MLRAIMGYVGAVHLVYIPYSMKGSIRLAAAGSKQIPLTLFLLHVIPKVGCLFQSGMIRS